MPLLGWLPSQRLINKEDFMAQPTPGSNYTVQNGDTLSSIALSAYGNSDEWHQIYIANAKVIGDNPNALSAGTTLFIPNSLQIARILQKQESLAVNSCTVTASDGVNVRAAPTTSSAIIASYPCGTVLYYLNCVYGERIDGNPNWAVSIYGHYFWLGATDHPTCP
jgi:hypothetical protein